jgi:hypothetical protein
VASTPEARFQVKNGNQSGVVRGGLMEFELVIHAGGGLQSTERGVALNMDVARAQHVATRSTGGGQ